MGGVVVFGDLVDVGDVDFVYCDVEGCFCGYL